jgi:hypothetical protein
MDRPVTSQLHEMRILNHTGDTKVIWDRSKPAEVAHAQKTFDDMKKQGYDAFRVGADGKKTELLQKFDPSIEAMILTERIVGG